MQFQTKVNIPSSSFKIGYQDKILMLGSCFSDEVSAKMSEYFFRVTANPCGALYNPISIADALTREDDVELVEHRGLWHSFAHHGSFSSADYDETLSRCREAQRLLRTAYEEATVVIVTLGSAYVYEREGRVVANCHKFPSADFVRRRLTVEEIVSAWRPILAAHPDKHFLFTVSPIRHLKDGLHDNQLSKSILLLAIDELVSSAVVGRGASPSYFPSYEIVLDELRDYRYYADDMLHPSRPAVEYIFERFVDTYMSADTLRDMSELHRLWLDEHHTLLHPDSPESQAFLRRLRDNRAALAPRFPWI